MICKTCGEVMIVNTLFDLVKAQFDGWRTSRKGDSCPEHSNRRFTGASYEVREQEVMQHHAAPKEPRRNTHPQLNPRDYDVLYGADYVGTFTATSDSEAVLAALVANKHRMLSVSKLSARVAVNKRKVRSD